MWIRGFRPNDVSKDVSSQTSSAEKLAPDKTAVEINSKPKNGRGSV